MSWERLHFFMKFKKPAEIGQIPYIITFFNGKLMPFTTLAEEQIYGL
jgi:hypothetical protein